MMPEHCKNVSVHQVKFELTPKNIEKELINTSIYKGTEYLILNNGKHWSVIRVGKTPKKSLFWIITSIEIISLPQDTLFVSDPGADVLNINVMNDIAQRHPGKTVVVQGRFEHISFVKAEEPIELAVLDVQPPSPPKLNVMINEVLRYRSFSKPIKLQEQIIDINPKINNAKSDVVILPCQASEFNTDKKVLYLDERPDLEDYDQKDITLVGCELSLRIFRELYKFTPDFINICPVKLVEETVALQNRPVLIKCCKVNNFERQDNLLIVPWGVTYEDLEDALLDFIRNDSN